MVKRPSISVGIPSTRSFDFIFMLLNKIEYIDYKVEIVISRLSDSLFTEKDTQRISSCKIVQVTSPKQQSTSMRNSILDHVKSDYVLFLDDDMIPSSDILIVCNELILQNPNCVFQGTPYNVYNSENWLARMEGKQYERIFSKKIKANNEIDHIDARILLAPVKLLREIRFDERLINGRDGHDLAERILKKNIRIYYAPNLTGRHFYRDKWKSVIKQKIRQGKGRGQILLSKKKSLSQWTTFLLKDFYGHFIKPILNTLLGRITFSDLAYILTTHMFYWLSTLNTILLQQKL